MTSNSGKARKPRRRTIVILLAFALAAFMTSACLVIISAASNPVATTAVCDVGPSWDDSTYKYVIYAIGVDYFSTRKLHIGATYRLTLTQGYDPATVGDYPVRDILSATPVANRQNTCSPPLHRAPKHS